MKGENNFKLLADEGVSIYSGGRDQWEMVFDCGLVWPSESSQTLVLSVV